jgi:hypothetical protein
MMQKVNFIAVLIHHQKQLKDSGFRLERDRPYPKDKKCHKIALKVFGIGKLTRCNAFYAKSDRAVRQGFQL